jgi:hypothetical protein
MLEVGDVQVMNRFQRLAPGSINALDLILDVAIAVFFGQIRGGAVGGATDLATEFVSFCRGPVAAQVANFDVELAELLVHLQVLNPHEFRHGPSRLLFLNPEP